MVAVAVSMSVMEYNNYGAYNAAYQPYTSYSSYTQQPSHFNLKVGQCGMCRYLCLCAIVAIEGYVFVGGFSLCLPSVLIFCNV